MNKKEIKIQRSKDPALFFSKKEKEQIMAAIQETEMNTSGEIRVHLERKTEKNILEQARNTFEKIGMTQTKEKNSVLIYLCVKSHQFAILGDQGIHQKVPEDFWDEIAKEMSQDFKKDEFANGLVKGILKVGEKLKTYFPYQRNDLNELPDEISYSL